MSKLDGFHCTTLSRWSEVWRFGESATIVRGASPRPIKNFITTESTGVNWIKIGDVKPGDKYITASAEKSHQRVQKNRVLSKREILFFQIP